jgi:methyl-accepting chemotaxis protein
MVSISHIKIGRQIASLLGANVVLLTVLSGLSLWAIRMTERLTDESAARLGSARLAETVAGETAAIAHCKAQMIIAKQAYGDLLSQLDALRKGRKAALEQLAARASTPEDTRQAADLAGMIQKTQASTNSVLSLLRSGRYAEAAGEFRTSSDLNAAVRAKAKDYLRGQEALAAENASKRRQTSSTVWMVLIAGGLLAAAGAIFSGFVLTGSIARPLSAAVSHLDRIAQGDLSNDAPPEFQARGDEIGTLGRAMQAMTVALRKMIREITGGVQVLASSSGELTSGSEQVMSGTRHTSEKAASVAAAAEEMSANIGSVAAGMEQTATNLVHVTGATEQMTASISEIAQNSEKARNITSHAARQAARITGQMNQLGEAAREIGKVTEAITEISSQTNLLALNATIEAARAGAAGKGFAVVATEIKALAQQTAAATEDIRGRIAGVQSATAGGIEEIGKVAEVIQEVSAIVASIAAAIEEQSVTTKDIARNIAEASAGVSDANLRVAQTSQVSREIAADIVAVDAAAREMRGSGGRVRTSADELSRVADVLRLAAGSFHS